MRLCVAELPRQAQSLLQFLTMLRCRCACRCRAWPAPKPLPPPQPQWAARLTSTALLVLGVNTSVTHSFLWMYRSELQSGMPLTDSVMPVVMGR